MIKTLHIRNYAIIEELEVHFSEGLTILTGETGAGKSIVLGALGLIMGKRADAKALFNDAQKCIVEGIFDISEYNIQSFFEENDIDYEAETVVRREITPTGRSRTFVNDTPVNLKVLQQLSGSLVDLHQQFDTLDIHDVSFQLRMVDALAANNTALADYQQLFRSYRQHQLNLVKLINQSEQAAKETDFLTFQLEELNTAALVAGEQEELEQALSKLNNAETIKKKLSQAFMALTEQEQSIVGQLNTLSVALNQIRNFHPDIEAILSKYDGLILELEEVAKEFEQIADDTEYDGAKILETQDRLDLIYRLQHKHHVTDILSLVNIQEELEAQLNSYADLSSEILQLEAIIDEEEAKLRSIAATLSEKRQSIVPSFQKRVHKLLSQLSMEHARIKVQITASDHLLPSGMDIVEFLFAPNKGSKFQSIKNVASGGELSRLTLCIKSLVASSIPLPTLIFDEIDSGVSGDVALKMGHILRKLSNEHQVTVITHSPQVASKADVHYYIYKKVSKNRTYTKVRKLEGDEKIRAIATMLSQSPPSDYAIENAKELLALC